MNSSGKLALAAAVMTMGIAPARASTVGVAVASIGSSAQVGLAPQNDALLGGAAIEFFIPLGDASGTYGVGWTCGLTGFGTCSDNGDGGGTLTMILRFSPVTAGPNTLTAKFEDLDLIGANDPANFFESLNVLDSHGVSLTGLITNIGGLVTGDSNEQILSLGVNAPADPLYLEMQFKSSYNQIGTNTPEYLRATIDSSLRGTPVPVPLSPMPLPASLVIVFAGWYMWRKRQIAA